MCNHRQFMDRAVELARHTSLIEKAGGPFGCVIVRAGTIVGEGVNRVLAERDPTCHGEVAAIRAACSALGTHDLSGCVMYTSCEPCPMCYAAAWWARIEHIYYGATIEDAMEYGDFDDLPIYEAVKLPGPDRRLPATELGRAAMLDVWKAFRDMPDHPHY